MGMGGRGRGGGVVRRLGVDERVEGMEDFFCYFDDG
jgi:hypothetical protein